MHIGPSEYDAIADLITAQLDPDDDAISAVRHDVEHAAHAIPGEIWRAALVAALRSDQKRRR